MSEPTVSILAPGIVAPDFTLASTAGHDVTLSSWRGRSNVLLAFFPLAFTGVCTTELCDFSEDVEAFERTDAKVFGISIDSIPTLNAFREARGITIDLLSDFKREVSRAYGTLLEPQFFSRRAYFIIDGDGVIRWSYAEHDLGDKRDNRELLERLAGL